MIETWACSFMSIAIVSLVLTVAHLNYRVDKLEDRIRKFRTTANRFYGGQRES